MSYFHESRSQTEQTQKSKRDSKQPIRRQHADNQTEKETSHSGGNREKKEEAGKKKSKLNKNNCFNFSFFICLWSCLY